MSVSSSREAESSRFSLGGHSLSLSLQEVLRDNVRDHRAGTSNLNFKKHTQVRLRVHHIVIPSINPGRMACTNSSIDRFLCRIESFQRDLHHAGLANCIRIRLRPQSMLPNFH